MTSIPNPVIEHEPHSQADGHAELATTARALAVPATPLPIFSGAQMAEALTAYRSLQSALDRSMPDQIMELDGKPFRKKGYWRAIAVAFGLTVEPVSERRETSGQFEDGRENFGYVVSYRAMAPNGRAVSGDGSCFAVEKAPRSAPWKELPRQATIHNVRSHAHTRAFNRAVSNLVGFGEVSAEEVEREDNGHATHAAPVRSNVPVRTPSTPNGAVTITNITTKPVGKGATQYQVFFSDGQHWGTISQTLGQLCMAFWNGKNEVRYETEVNGKFTNLKHVWKIAGKAEELDEPDLRMPSDDEIPF